MNKNGRIRRRATSTAIAASLLLAVSSTGWAANISVGNHVILPNTANQTVSIFVTGGEQIAGEDFFAQVGDGGTFNGGVNTKPALTNVNIVTESVFTGNNNGDGDPGNNTSHPLIWVDGTTTLSGTVPANGRLAILTFDTTGLNSGTFALKLTGVASSLGSFNTTLRSANGSATSLGITNGSLIVAVPQPWDFNLDGAVDAADYVVWRKGFGTTYTQNDYDLWRANFGQTFGSGAIAATAVPEPASLILLLAGISAIYPRRRTAVR